MDDEDFNVWYAYVNGRIGMRIDAEERRNFFYDVRNASRGKPVSQTAFVLAHATWYANGYIPQDVFSESKKDKLLAINQFGTNYKSVIHFIADYLDQTKLEYQHE